MDNIIAYQKFLDSKNDIIEKMVHGYITINEYNDHMEILNNDIVVQILNDNLKHSPNNNEV